ncbi:hypothetical protein [Fundidesulfovibrio agrisoli]|uniref:hypothetical protein n=1 Tax=Fundidesulfovibrio agrisoli TaxID=2922717 RepID=UPI001FACC7C9|nr:hypothetical protein [Fundidesulfovibrio agrisoli]
MHRFIACLLLAGACVLCWAQPPGHAQNRITQDEIARLADKVKAQRDAYLSFENAEQEANQDGASERAAVFREAKLKAKMKFLELDADLQKALAAKSAQDRADQQAVIEH